MNKKLFNIGVVSNKTDKMEKLLNMYHVGLNDWNRSKEFEVDGHVVVNYTVLTTKEIFESICNSFTMM